jgi:hypothetical protein
MQYLGLHILDKGGRLAVSKPQPHIEFGDGKEVAGVSAWLRNMKNIPLPEPFFHNQAARLLERVLLRSV